MKVAPALGKVLAVAGVLAVLGSTSAAEVDLPGPLTGPPGPSGPEAISGEDAEIAAQPICIGSTVHSLGRLGDALLYRRERRPDGTLAVGYYVFYSEERPWGNNWLTWTVVPALALDLVYSRALLVAPGAQRALYGKGDVEGFRVLYEDRGPELRALSASTDDAHHRPIELGPGDLYGLDPAAITLYTRAWNHHLGERGALPGELVERRCYGPSEIRPLTAETARAFHLERRALSAAVGPIAPDVDARSARTYPP